MSQKSKSETGPFTLKPIEKNMDLVAANVTRVQNYWGDSGIIRWVGPLKGQHWGKGQYAAVEYDNPNPTDERRGDGVFEDGQRYCQTSPYTCAFNPIRHLYFEVNPLVVKHLRAQFGDSIKHFHDFELIKVAIARNFDSAEMDGTLAAHLKWYETDHPNPATEWFHPLLAAYFPTGFINGCDREGNLLHYARVCKGGAISPPDFIKEVGVDALTRMVTIQYEEMKATLRAKGFSQHRRYTSLYDLKNLGFIDGKTMDFAKAFAEVTKNHQLEIVAKVIMINCPLLFRAVIKTIFLFLDERTAEKVVVLGEDYQEELAKHIDPSLLPDFAGGKNVEWLNREGRMGQVPPEADPPVTYGVIGEAYDPTHISPRAKKTAEKVEKAKLKAENQK